MTKADTIELKVRAILTAGTFDRKQAEDVLKLWRDNCRACYDAVGKNTAAMLFLALVFTLLATASLAEISVFGLKFNQAHAPLVLLHVTCSFLFYRALTIYAYAQLIAEAIREADFQLYRTWQAKGLLDLAMPPAPIEIEQALSNTESDRSLYKRVADAWGILLVIFSCLGTTLWLYWSCTALISNTSIPAALSITTVTVSTLFVLRGVLSFIHFIHRGA